MAEETKGKGDEIIEERVENRHLTNSQPKNIAVRNVGQYPVINFSFMLRVEGVFDLPCKSIKGFRRENEFEYIQEGGLNDYVHLKRKPISKPFTFQVERYVGVDYLDPMPMGTEIILPVILFVNKYAFHMLKPVRTYAFTGCTVIAKDYGELNAEASGLLTEITTIAYREMICIDIPSQTLEQDVWNFDGKAKGGDGNNRHYNQSTWNTEMEKDYYSKEKMIETAELHRWEIDGISKEGKKIAGKDGKMVSKQSAQTVARIKDNDYIEPSKEDLLDKAKKHHWEFNGIDKNGKKNTQSAQTVGKVKDNNYAELPKKDMVGKARRWTLNETKEGEGQTDAQGGRQSTQSAQTIGKLTNGSFKEPTREEMDTKAKLWGLDGDKKEGKGTQSAQTRTQIDKNALLERSKTVMQKNASRWEFDGTKKNGKDNMQSAQTIGKQTDSNYKEPAREEMDTKAKRWELDGEKKEGKGTQSAQTIGKLANTEFKEPAKENMDGKAKLWGLDGDKKDGKGTQSAQTRTQIDKNALLERSKTEMQKNANRWEFDGTKKNGKDSLQSAQTIGKQTDSNYKEPAKENMDGKAKLWELDGGTKGGKGTQSAQTRTQIDKNAVLERTKAEMQKNANRWPTVRSAKDIMDFLNSH